MKNLSFRTIVKAAVISLFVGTLLGYAYRTAQPFLSGPALTLSHPSNNMAVEEPLITVEGTVHNLSHLTLNGRPIAMTQEGVFREQLLLLPGYNIIEIVGHDRFGRSISTSRRIVYNGEDGVPAQQATSSSPLAQTTTRNHD